MEKAQTENSTLKGHLYYVDRDRLEADTLLRDIEQLLGEHFVGLPVKFRSSPDRLEANRFNWSSERATLGEMIEYITLHQVELRSRLDPLRQCIHIRADYRGHHAAYAISKECLTNLPEDYLVRKITAGLAREVVRAFREARQNVD